jgi:hypothetical protein
MERKSLFAKRNASANRPETFAIRVDSYDTANKPNTVRGTRIDNDAEVVVFLRDVDYNSSGRFKRSEISTFAEARKDRQHPGTAPGGVLLIQEAQAQADGTFGARWIQSLSHTEDEAEVFIATVHVSPVKKGKGNKDFSLMTLMHDGDFSRLTQEMGEALKLTPPFVVDTVKDLRDAVESLLTDEIGVGVRVSNAENFDALYVSRKKDLTVKQSVDGFMASIAELEEQINSGELTCEVIPYGNVWAGPATTEIMLKNKVVQSRLARFNDNAVGSNGNTYPVSVFRPTIVAARMTKADAQGKRSVFFSHFEPLYTRQPVHGLVNAIAHAQTEVLAPEPPKMDGPGQKPGAAAPGAEPEAGPETDHGSFEAGGPGSFDDVDLMQAAGSIAGGEPAAEEAPAQRQPRRYTGGRRS